MRTFIIISKTIRIEPQHGALFSKMRELMTLLMKVITFHNQPTNIEAGIIQAVGSSDGPCQPHSRNFTPLVVIVNGAHACKTWMTAATGQLARFVWRTVKHNFIFYGHDSRQTAKLTSNEFNRN